MSRTSAAVAAIARVAGYSEQPNAEADDVDEPPEPAPRLCARRRTAPTPRGSVAAAAAQRSRSPPRRRSATETAPMPIGRVADGWCWTPEPDARYVLIDTRLGVLLRQMTASQVRNLLTNALHRHQRGDRGQFATTSLRVDDGKTTVFWQLHPQAGNPAERVAFLDCDDSGIGGD